jgi:hypothetical protein
MLGLASTYCAITKRRAILLQRGWKKKVASVFLRDLVEISTEGAATAALWLGPKYPAIGNRGQKKRSVSRFGFGDVPALADINDVHGARRLLLDLKNKS